MAKPLQNILALLLLALLARCGSSTVTVETPTEADSPFFAAIAAGKLDVVKEEIAANPDRLDQGEGAMLFTPLHKAVATNQLEIARFLIESGADVNATDALRRRPLVVAQDANATPEMLQLLKDNGAED